MPTTTPEGIVIPAAGDDLLGAWPAFAASICTIQEVPSVAAARTSLERGRPATSAHPRFFSVAGILYRADGTRSPSGALILSAVNETEFYDQPFSPSGKWGMSPKDHTDLGSFALPVRPYRRRVTATATLWATVTGACDLCVAIGSRRQYARIPAESWGASATVTISALVLEGQAVTITAGAFNFSGTTTQVTYGGGDAYNGLTISASPVTMA